MKKIHILLIIIMTFMIAMVGCSAKDINTDGSENGKEESLVLNLEGGDWGYPSPYTHYSRGPGAYKMRLIFDSLLERGEEGLIPWLAEDWNITNDGKTYTFNIRENVKWQDGQDMTAEDVKFSFEYYAKHPPVFDELNISKNNFIEKINIIDNHTISINVDNASATLLERFGSARILPKHIWNNVADPKKFNSPKAVVGCGPYILKDYKKEQGAYKFKAFKDYWGPKQKVDTIQFIPVSDNILAFEKGDIDITRVTPDILDKYEDDSKYKIIKNPGFWGYRLMFNMDSNPQFKDKVLRQAIAYAIDKDELIEKVARGAAKPASAGYIPIDHRWYNKKVRKYDFNLDKSKKLLDGKKYSFTLLTGNRNQEVRIGELMKLSLEKVGIDLKVKSVDMKSRDAAVKNGDYEMVLIGHGGWGNDADMLREKYVSEENNIKTTFTGGIPGYGNDMINNLAKKQLSELDLDKRKEIVYNLQEVIAEEIPQIPLYNTTGYDVYRPSKYDGWRHVFDHHTVTHNKISYLEME